MDEIKLSDISSGNGHQSADMIDASDDPLLESSTLVLQRRIYRQHEYDATHPPRNGPDSSTFARILAKLKKKPQFSKQCVGSCLMLMLPILSSLWNYKLRYLPRDLLAGVTVAFMHIGQGVSFGLLATLSPAHGLYTSFFPVLVHAMFGTSPHLASGTQSLIALLVASAIAKQIPTMIDGIDVSNSTTVVPSVDGIDEALELRAALAAEFTLYVGGFLLLMWGLRLSFIQRFLSEPFVESFLSAAGITIITSLLGKMTGVPIKQYSGPLTNVYTWVDLFANITTVNVGDIVITIITLFVLIIVKDVISERYKSKIPIPIPIDIIVIIIATIVSYFGDMRGNFSIQITGKIPKGLPAPAVPPLSHMTGMLVESFIVAIIIYGLSISVGKLCAKRHNYVLNSQQELFALGISNFVSAFFHCFPSCVSPPRAMLNSELFVKTTLAGIISSCVILLVLMVVGGLLETLPIACLAAIVAQAVKGLVFRTYLGMTFWKISLYDFSIWFVTYFCTLFLGIDNGFIIGFAYSMFITIFQKHFHSGIILRTLTKEDILTPNQGPDVAHICGVKIYRLVGSLMYYNADAFRHNIYKRVFKPEIVSASEQAPRDADDSDDSDDDVFLDADEIWALDEALRFLIIDFRSVSIIDVTGLNVLIEIVSEYQAVDVTVFLAECSPSVLKVLKAGKFMDIVSPDNIFLDAHDALAIAKKKMGGNVGYDHR